jgi:signal transduction histidine kinase
MRTPLNTIINMIKMMQGRTKDRVLLDWIRVANNSTNLLLFLVNDTLDYFQLKSGKFARRDCNFTVKELIENTFELITV